MVLDSGEVREFAPPQELLADEESIFYSLAKQANLVSNIPPTTPKSEWQSAIIARQPVNPTGDTT